MAAIRKGKQASGLSEHYNELFALVLSALGLLLLLAVVSFSPDDPSGNGTGFGDGTRGNWIGLVGAWVTDLIFQAVGQVLYLTPVLFVVAAIRVYRLDRFRLSAVQFLGYILLVVSVAGLLGTIGYKGGVIGKFVGLVVLAEIVSKVGAVIVLLLLTAVSAVVVFNFSFVSSFESMTMGYRNFRVHFDEWWERRRGRQMEKALEHAAKRSEKKSGRNQPMPETRPAGAGPVKPVRKMRSDESEEEASVIVGEMPFEALDDRDGEPSPPAPVEEPDDVPFDTGRQAAGGVEEEDLGIDDGEVEAEESVEPVAKPVREKAATRKKKESHDGYELPPTDFLVAPEPEVKPSQEEIDEVQAELEQTMESFNVKGRVQKPMYGPVVTTFPFKPDPGVKYSRVTGLEDDLCLALKAESIRIDRIPGKAFVGIEVPNKRRETIQLREVIESKKFDDSKSLLTLALGKTIDGETFVADLAKMPHLLIAGATGAGKSVGVNTLVVSILYKARPEEVKFIMVDPKRLELGVYADIPHLATPIITDPKRAAISLRWAVSEMEKRYKELAGWGVRNIDGFNAEVKRRNEEGLFDDDGNPHRTLPYIVIIIDELADLMMVSGKEVEESITRLAQMARAVVIHLVLATQRPSVDVITGLIKANFPSRISFRVSSKVDSRTIIDANGAERLLGRGDMLFLPPASSQVIRVHGAYVDEKEIHKIVEHIKSQGGEPEYDANITKSEEEKEGGGEAPGRKDPLFWDAVRSVIAAKRASTSLLQRNLRIGYGRAAGLLDAMVAEGYIGETDGSSRARTVLPKAYEDLQEFEQMSEEG